MSEQPIKHDQIIEEKVFAPAIASAEALLEKINSLIGGFKQLITITGKKIPLADPKTISEAEQLAAALKKIADLEKGLTQAQKAQITAQTIINKQKAEFRKELQAEVSAYQKLQNEFARAAQKAKDLAASQGIGSKAAKQAAIEANTLNQKLKDIDATLGIHNRNVGDYKGKLKE